MYFYLFSITVYSLSLSLAYYFVVHVYLNMLIIPVSAIAEIKIFVSKKNKKLK
ncbi:MAG: hypothetical protein MRECE_10c046 [Mycoplasmataceae bacterium CE_OT135]|nr:MAG: hypothetical protein MRECE_10c046 [Mycoplasmataceae bacterium CE_OT135]